MSERQPVNTLEQAAWWFILAYDLVNAPLLWDEPLPPAGLLVCDLFWMTEREFRLLVERLLVDMDLASRQNSPRMPRRRGPFERSV